MKFLQRYGDAYWVTRLPQRADRAARISGRKLLKNPALGLDRKKQRH